MTFLFSFMKCGCYSETEYWDLEYTIEYIGQDKRSGRLKIVTNTATTDLASKLAQYLQTFKLFLVFTAFPKYLIKLSSALCLLQTFPKKSVLPLRLTILQR